MWSCPLQWNAFRSGFAPGRSSSPTPPSTSPPGLGDVPETARPLVATLWGVPPLGRTAARLADGARIAWRDGDWDLPEDLGVIVMTRSGPTTL